MKKALVVFIISIFVCLSLYACSDEKQSTNENADIGQKFNMQQNERSNHASFGELQFLSNRYGESACNTENGYYYLTFETTKLRDGNYGLHLMYMDFASGREIYLCSTAGCKHDSLDCPSVFLYDDFPSASTQLFIFQDNLYILSREYDNDGSVSQDVINIGKDNSSVEKRPAALYRANLDGTERKKIYTFNAAFTLEDKVIGNDKGIYVITKKLSYNKDGNQTYTTSSERKLMFLDFDTLSLNEVCQMDFGDHISWQIIGCCKNNFLLCGTDFGREISRDETWNDDVYKELYKNSFEVYALLDSNGGKPEELIRLSNSCDNSVKLLEDSLYISTEENQNIESLNIKTGEKKILCTLPQNLMMDTLGDTLCCRNWKLSEDSTWYFVDTKTGKVTHTPLVNLCNGWALDFRGETMQDVLFIYDYDATNYHDGSYEIHQYKHALMKKDDLFAGKDNYRKIEMIGSGY